jgi:hypothetical protein
MGAISCHFVPLRATLDHFWTTFFRPGKPALVFSKKPRRSIKKIHCFFPCRGRPAKARAATRGHDLFGAPQEAAPPEAVAPRARLRRGAVLDCQRTSRPLRWPYHILRGKLKMVTGPWRRVPGKSHRLSATARGRPKEEHQETSPSLLVGDTMNLVRERAPTGGWSR